MYNHIYEYGGDPNQISLIGHSAEAGIVVAIRTNQTFLQDHSLNLSVLKHIICLDTKSYDVRDQIESNIKDPEAFTDCPDFKVWKIVKAFKEGTSQPVHDHKE